MAVTKARKNQQIEELGTDLKKVSNLVVATYSKLTVAQADNDPGRRRAIAPVDGGREGAAAGKGSHHRSEALTFNGIDRDTPHARI